MSKRKRRNRGTGNRKDQLTKQRLYIHLVVIALGLLTLAAGVFYLLHAKQTGAQTTVPPAARMEFESLKGRWQRPDGGYVLEIREIDTRGKMTAAYFNPRPINVSQAEASLEGSHTKVFIELRDTNYPGATYTFTYDPQSDRLRGVYFQPALQQSFDVFFVRMK